MRHHEARVSASRIVRQVLAFTIPFPLVLAFFAHLEGQNPAAALANAKAFLAVLTPSEGIWLPWFLINAAVLLYLMPVLKFAHSGLGSADPGQECCAKAAACLDHLDLFVIPVSAIIFALPAMIGTSFSEEAHFFATPQAYEVAQDLSTGFLVGVALSVNLGNILFPVRRQAVLRSPGARLARHSLYQKIFLIISALVLFTVFQLFSSSGAFFRLGAETPGLVGGLTGSGHQQGAFRAAELLPAGAKDEALKGLLEVFYIRVLILLIIVGELFWQIKLLFLRPLVTILKRLAALNEEKGDVNSEIEIVQNDEFSRVYAEINKLVRKQAAQLEASRGRLGSITANAADPILVYDSACAILEVNPAAERYFGRSAQEATGRPLTDFLSASGFQDALGSQDLDAEKVFAPGADGLSRFTARSKDGRELKFEAHVSRVEGPEGRTYTAVLRDVLRQVELEESLRGAKRAAENANRLKSEFLANMSHELRTPLNAVLGFTQLLAADKSLGERQLEKIEIISHSGEHLLALINDILDISKIEAGKVESRIQPFDLVEFLDDMRQMFALRCRQKGLALYVEPTGEIPRWVSGDLGKLRQVVINLVGNAVKFTSEGGVDITVGREGNRIRFAVVDSGKGIPADELDLVMQPFTQSTITDHEGGTGLGLAISTRYVEMMGGKLEVASEEGKGSTFSFAIELPETAERPEAPGSDLVPVAVKAGSEATVLIVDDKETNRLVLKEMLEAVGFQTLEAADGKEALDLALERRPAIVFMDIRMPVMDGYEAARQLKARPEGRDIKVFALTASAFRHDEERIAAAGFDGFLAKPFKRSALFHLIRDKTSVQLEYEAPAPEAGASLPDLSAEDFRAARSALGETRVSRIAELAMVGDYGGLKEVAAAIQGQAPGVAAHLKAAAASFDERAMGDLVSRLGQES